MSNIDPDLVLHLALDELRGDRFLDASARGGGRRSGGFIRGTVTTVPDSLFGACASFSGSADGIEVSNNGDLLASGDATLEAWVFVSVKPSEKVRIVGKGSPATPNYGLWSDPQNWAPRLLPDTVHPQLPPGVFPPLLQLNTWYHLAAVFQGRETSYYIHDAQGQLLAQPPKTPWTGQTAIGMDPLTIGAGANGGRLANVRVYKRALSQAEIEQDIRLDLMGLAAFRKSHPIDFRVFDDDEQAVLYIGEDAAGHNLNLELRNTSPQAIQFANGSSAVASEANHHFALRFRPGTLSEGVLKLLVNPQERAKLLKQADQWDLYFPPKPPAANEAASLYLLYKGPSKTFLPNETRTLTLQRMSAAPGSGARGTQVELIPRQLTAAGGDATPITGSRTQYVHITNQRGKKNIPLHAGFAGGNSVLNDGKSPNALRLRITNASKTGEIALTPKTGGAPSKFIVSFDAQPQGQTREWALVTTGDSKNVKVIVNGREIPPEGIEGETPEWPIAFDAALSLAAGKPLQIDLTGIVSSLPSGHANLYVRYENIPGYWDGQFVCTVEKGPLLVAGQNVGIGVAAPAAPLHVKGSVRIQGQIETDPTFKLLVNAADLNWDANWPEKNRMVLQLEPRYATDVYRTRVFLYAPNAYYTNEPAITLAGNYGGGAKVGIGTTDPVTPLHVKGEVRVEGAKLEVAQESGLAIRVDPAAGKSVYIGRFEGNSLEFDYAWGQALNSTASLSFNIDSDNDNTDRHIDFRANGRGFTGGSSLLRIQENGNVGIGTTAPISRLHVDGDILATGRIYCAGGVAIYNGASGAMNTNGWSLDTKGGNGQQIWGPLRGPAGWEFTGVPRSDLRLKKDVQTLPQALKKVLNLRGVSFKWNDSGLERLTQFAESYDAGPSATEEEHQQLRKAKRADACEKLSRPEIGLIAQEVRDVAPELVSEDEDGYLGVAYERTVALLIEAIKEQQSMIQALSEKIAAMAEE